MKSVGKTDAGAFLAATLTAAASSASAVTWELSGKLIVESTFETPQELLNLEGTPFFARLAYNEAATPRLQTRDSTYYPAEGNLSLTAGFGSMVAELEGFKRSSTQGNLDSLAVSLGVLPTTWS
jgi:hypothetical protein